MASESLRLHRVLSGFVSVTVASLIGGLVVAALAGGAQPAQITYSAVAVVGAGALISGAHSFRKRRRTGRAPTYSGPVPQSSAGGPGYDLATVEHVNEFLRWHAIPWISDEKFDIPWLDERVTPFREALRVIDDRSPATSGFGLEIELARLADALRSFLTVYEAVTVADPLFRDSSWRLVRVSELESAGVVTDGAVKLRSRAARIVEAYMRLQGTSERPKGYR